MERPDRPAWTPADAARMYGRVVASWAMDALVLRRAGLDTPSWRVGLAAAPGRAARIAPSPQHLASVGVSIGVSAGG